MSWEVDHEEIKNCPCKKGSYTIQQRSDDWGREDEKWIMNCPYCKQNYKLEATNYHEKGIQLFEYKWVKKEL